MKNFILLAIFSLYFANAYSQINESQQNSADTTGVDPATGPSYLPIIPTSPLPPNYVPAKPFPRKPQTVQSGHFISMAGYSDPPEITHAHIPTSVTVNTGKDVGEIVINSQSSMGSVNYSIPIESVAGRNGLHPEVSISYSSGGSNGVLGYGWGIGGLSSIVTSNFTSYYDGVTNSASLNQLHPFALDGMRLLETSNSGGIITYEPEQGNLRIKGYLSGSIVKYFTVEYPNGSLAVYGFTNNVTGQIYYPITQMKDISGNLVTYEYSFLNNQYYISKISFGGVENKAAHYASLEFFYKTRTDVESFYLFGKEIQQNRLLEKIEVKADGSLIRKYEMTYTTDRVSLLLQVNCFNGGGGELNPVKFYYGYDNNRTENLTTLESQLLEYFTSGDLDLRKGKFDAGTDDDGLMVFPKVKLDVAGQPGGLFQKEKWWFYSKIHPSQQLLVYQGLQDNFNIAVKLTAETNFMELTSGDLDGKHGEEVIKINNNDIGGWDNVKFKVYQPNIYSGLALKYERSYNLTPSINFRGHNTSLWPKQYFAGDFKGIGRDMIFAVSMKNPLGMSYNSRCYLIDLENNVVLFNAHVFNWNNGTDQVIPMDFNGDGKLDILHITPNGTDVYSFNTNNQLVKIKTISNFKTTSFSDRQMVMGDINGDGKADILVSPKESYYQTQYVQVPVSMPSHCHFCGSGPEQIDHRGGMYHCNNCDNFLEPSDRCFECNTRLTFHCGQYLRSGGENPMGGDEECCPVHGRSVYMTRYTYVNNGKTWKAYLSTGEAFFEKDIPIIHNESGYKFHLEDVNQDGKGDMVRITGGAVRVYLNENGVFDENNYKYAYTTGNAIIVPSSVSHPHYHSFLMGVGVNQSGKLYKVRFSKNEAKQRLLTGMQNSRGIVQRNFYQRMNENASWGGSYDNVYTQGYGAQAPYRNFTGPVWLAARTDAYLNGEIIANTGYNYYNAVVHVEGLGFRGFEKTSTYDHITGRIYEQTFDPINKFGAMTKAESAVNEINIQYYFSIASNKKATLLPSYTTSLDKLKGITTTKSVVYDSYGNPTNESTSYSGSNITQSVATTYQNTVNSNTFQIGLPLSVNSTTNRGGNSWSTKQEFTYDALMRPQSKISKVNNHTVGQTAWTYDGWGNVLTEKSQAFSSGTWLENKYEYDPAGRFVTKSTNPLNQHTTYSGYNVYGKPTTVTDHKGNITSSEFDHWGRLKKVTNPDGTIDNKMVSWAGAGVEGALILVTESGTGTPVKKTYTDARGREIRTSITRFDNAELKTDKAYDLYGRLSGVSLPYSSGNALWNIYSYDQHDRTTKVTAANGNTVTYSYNGNSVTETKNSITSTKQYDVLGNVTSVTDAGGTITYNLRADGQPTSVVAPGNITTTFEYDPYGRRTKIVDPSAGTKTFAYDQWGNTNKETDANGKVTDIVYDQYGRIVSKTTPELSTTYTYNPDGLLQAETSTNGTGKNMTYDVLGRTLTFKETGADGKWLQKSYTYSEGKIASISYATQSGTITTETSNYQNGYLKSITLTGGQVIYDLQQENAMGRATKVLSGPVTRNYSFDQYGVPTGRSAQTQTAGTYMNFEYNFNAATGNLNYRKDITRNITENFTYDNLNRLTGFGGQTVSFDNKGNVTQKSGIGNYHYLNTGKPYALTGIVQAGNVIPERQQQITYASFSRPLTITEDGYTAQFIYEAGGDRVKMHVTKNGAPVLTRHYLANQYELDEKPGSTREKLYLGGDYYSAGAVLVRDNGGAWQVFYINSDYLGSVTHVVNSVGAVVAEYSYDAWGRLRNPVTHAIYGDGQQPELFLGRGYTGHEHLNWFGLINMNARLYDPVHGRFLAPDPYVQAPDFTQSFNRYSYVWNNPLSYIDQDGEFIWIPIAIGAIIGGYSGYKIGKANGATGWGMFGYIAGGAAIGGVAGYTGGAVAAAIGKNLGFAGAGVIAGAAGGSVAGAISGGGFAALGGGNIGEGIWKGAVSGLVGGGVGAYIGGGGGAFAGGAAAGGLSTALYEGDLEDIAKGALLGGAVAFGGYQIQQGVSYWNYRSDGGDFTYKQFRKISVASQRSFARGREFGGWILDNGDVAMWKPGQKAGITPTSKPSNATGFFHSHPNWGGNWLEMHSPADINANNNWAKTNSYVIGRQNVWLQTPGASPSILFPGGSFLYFNTYPYNYYWLSLKLK